MRQELYFDGILMDIDESTKITLVIKSNIFTEISKCVGNRTYSVQLPKTARNQRVLEFAHLPAANTNSNIPYRYLQCRYVRNGIEIFSDGYAYIISAKEKIEVCIVWGTPAVLRAIFSDGLKLNEIADDGKKAPYVRYNEVTKVSELALQDGYCYAAIDFLKYENIRLNDIYETSEAAARWPKMGYLRPCVFLWHILSRLQRLYGIKFTLDTDADQLISDLILPCVTDNVRVVSTAIKMKYMSEGLYRVTQENTIVCPYRRLNEDYYGIGLGELACDVEVDCDYTLSVKWNCDENELRRLIGNGLIGTRIFNNGVLGELKPATSITVVDSNGNAWDRYSGTNRTDTWTITAVGSVFDITIDAGSGISMHFYIDTVARTYHLEGGQLTFTPTVLSLVYGIDYPLTANFPNMKVTEFLQWVAAITGTFPRQTDKGNIVLEFVHYHKLFDNKDIAIDWSDKLVRAYDDGAPREIGFTVDGWAQENHFAYGNSDDVGAFADGVVSIPNVQLDEEQDVVGDVFDALRYPNNVPMYKVNSDDDSERLLRYLFPSEDRTDEPLEADIPDPCVLRINPLIMGGVYYAEGVFDSSLYWEGILRSNRYAGLVRSLKKAKILHEVFALSELDIKQFDETVPVYLAQYGHYYAVTEIKTSETGVAEVTLFQLEL